MVSVLAIGGSLRRDSIVMPVPHGQIDFYDDPRLIAQSADAVTEFFRRTL